MSIGPSFRHEIERSLPASLSLPDALGDALDWMEAHAHIGQYEGSSKRYGQLYPLDDPAGKFSAVAFHAADPADVRGWLRTDDLAILERLAVIVRTGGDGSMAGLWADDDGQQHLVHLGSGSGSTLACVLARDPIDFLRLLAIGYPEPCWDEDFGRTPQEVIDDNDFIDETAFSVPVRFGEWLTRRFDVTIPATGVAIVRQVAHLGDVDSDDPFCRWLGGLQQW